jgi:transposase
MVELYTRPLSQEEMVVCADEKTNLQPRPRLAATLPARPRQPIRLENEYKRVGALHLFAAFDTRTGQAYARTDLRKRQVEFIAFLSQLEQELPATKTHVHLVMDNLKMHKRKLVRDWFAAHPRFVCHFVPVHCSWMNQVEQWLSILQRKRLHISDFADLDHLAERLMAYVSEWNAQAHPFNWSTKSAAKVMAKCETQAVSVPAA